MAPSGACARLRLSTRGVWPHNALWPVASSKADAAPSAEHTAELGLFADLLDAWRRDLSSYVPVPHGSDILCVEPVQIESIDSSPTRGTERDEEDLISSVISHLALIVSLFLSKSL